MTLILIQDSHICRNYHADAKHCLFSKGSCDLWRSMDSLKYTSWFHLCFPAFYTTIISCSVPKNDLKKCRYHWHCQWTRYSILNHFHLALNSWSLFTNGVICLHIFIYTKFFMLCYHIVFSDRTNLSHSFILLVKLYDPFPKLSDTL